MLGGAGDDTYLVDNAGDTVVEGAGGGIDTVQSAITWTLGSELERLSLTGTAAIDGTGNALANSIWGNAADNTLNGGTGADRMTGNAGNDTYVVDNLGDVVVEAAGGGTDTVKSAVSWTLDVATENLTLIGAAAVSATGNAGANVLAGNTAANRLDGGAGADTMYGGAGDDTYVVDNAGDRLAEGAGNGIDTVEASVASWTLSAEVENLVLIGAAGLNGYGNSLANRLTGNANNNILNGAIGADTMIGGAGDDTYLVDNAGDTVVEAAGGGIDTVKSSITWAPGSELEKLTLTGTAAIHGTGNALANTMWGHDAANIFFGGDGADSLTGQGGNDVLNGDGGDDTLSGGIGNDTLRGGAGNDIYRWGPGGGQDIVTDTGGTDRIEIAAGVIASQVTLPRSVNHRRIGIAGSTA